MTSVGFGGSSSTSGFTGVWAQSSGISLPTGRAMDSGSVACLMIQNLGYARGRGASRSGTMAVGSAVSSLSIASAGAAASTGYQTTNAWLVAGGSTTFRLSFNGSFYFGRGGSGTNVVDSAGTTFSGTLGGAYTYVEAPSAQVAPTLTLTGDPTELQIDWVAPTSDGGTNVTGYRVRWWYADTPGTKTTIDFGLVLTTTLTGLTPGKDVVVQVTSKNAVTTAAGSVAVYSATKTQTLPSGGKVWNGTALVPGTIKVWNGTAVVQGIVQVWNGTTLVPAL